MAKESSKSSFLLFLVGLGCETQIYFFGCIALSELVIFAVAPILCIKNYSAMRRLGFAKFVNMMVLYIVALFVSSLCNHTPFPYVIKYFASLYSILCYYIAFYVLLKKNFNGVRWLFIGSFLSSLITIFAFHPTAQVSESGFAYIGNMETDEVVAGALFWVSKFKTIMQIPVCGFYLNFPLIFSVLIPIGYLVIALSTTTSGRAGSLTMLISGAMMIIGRKSRLSMTSIGKHFFSYLFIGILMLFAVKQTYVFAAKNGYLGDEARLKYERQSKQGNGMLTLLMHGRTGFFAAIPAALHRPIIGYGPNAADTEGFALRFILKYGDDEDLKTYYLGEDKANQVGYERKIPSHSYIMGAWVSCGVFGLIFYAWVLFLMARQVKRYMGAIPQWYGFFAMMLPYYLWNVFFSPMGQRWAFALLMVCLFFSRAVGECLIPLPSKMLQEIKKHEK